MSKNQRRTEVYTISIIEKQTKNDFLSIICLSNIIKDFFKNNKTDSANKNSFKIHGSNDLIYYYEDYEEDPHSNLVKVKFFYSIYNKNLEIINVSNLNTTKSKSKNEGDKERQHIVIKLYPNKNKAILVFEKIPGAISISSFESELNKFLNAYVNSIKGTDISINPVPSLDFLEELDKANKVSLIKVTVDKQRTSIDEDVIFSEDYKSRDEIDIIYKPTFRNSFSISKVKNYYENFKDGNDKIKRIVVEGSNKNGKIRLDTDGIKMSKYIKTKLDFDGLVDSDDIFNKYMDFISEFPDFMTDLILEQIACDIED